MPENRLPLSVRLVQTVVEETLAQEATNVRKVSKGYMIDLYMCPIVFGRQRQRLQNRVSDEGIRGFRIDKPGYYNHSLFIPTQNKAKFAERREVIKAAQALPFDTRDNTASENTAFSYEEATQDEMSMAS